ncbi:MAG: NAD-dependent epimerase/dehydratase family protein [Actinomycetota bacterium]
MRTLVTGGAGFIGSSVCRLLLERGHSVRALDNFLTGFRENVVPGVELFEGDLRGMEHVRRACRDIEVVFHQGAVRSVPRSVDDPLLSETSNVVGTLHVLLAAQAEGVRRVVYASSSSIYGDNEDAINGEDLPPQPLSPYALSKFAGERYCQIWTRLHGLSTVSLRYFNVFGPGQHPESRYAAVFPAFVSALVRGIAPEVHWDGEQSRDFTYIDDVVRANLLAAEANEIIDGEVINIGGGRPRTVNQVLADVSDAVGRWIDPDLKPKRAGDVRRTHADISKADRLLGWKPESDWHEAVAATVAWFKEKTPEST